MSLIALKCPSCGGNLEFEDSREFGFCQYCGTKIMISQEINNTVNNTVNNFNSTTIISNGYEEQINRKILAAQKAVSEANYEVAKKIANEILSQDTTFAEAYLVLMKCAALRDFREYGYILKSSETTVKSNYENYHLYSSDTRTFKEVLNDIGIDYTQQSVAEKLTNGAIADVQNGIKILNELMTHSVVKVKEKEFLKTLMGIYLNCPGLLVGLPEGLFDTPHFCDFVYNRNGAAVSFFGEYTELRLTYIDYQGFVLKMGKDTAFNSSTLEKYIQILKQTVSEPVTMWTMFSKKKDHKGNPIDVPKIESRLRKMVNSYQYYDAKAIELRILLSETEYYKNATIPTNKPPLYIN